jgi:hypothetical protein
MSETSYEVSSRWREGEPIVCSVRVDSKEAERKIEALKTKVSILRKELELLESKRGWLYRLLRWIW